jgi:hypothetical protein
MISRFRGWPTSVGTFRNVIYLRVRRWLRSDRLQEPRRRNVKGLLNNLTYKLLPFGSRTFSSSAAPANSWWTRRYSIDRAPRYWLTSGILLRRLENWARTHAFQKYTFDENGWPQSKPHLFHLTSLAWREVRFLSELWIYAVCLSQLLRPRSHIEHCSAFVERWLIFLRSRSWENP